MGGLLVAGFVSVTIKPIFFSGNSNQITLKLTQVRYVNKNINCFLTFVDDENSWLESDRRNGHFVWWVVHVRATYLD